MADDKKIIVNQKEIIDAWYEVDDATIAETEARKEYQRLHSIAEEKRHHFYNLLTDAQEYEEAKQSNDKA